MIYRIYSKKDAIIVVYDTNKVTGVDSLDKAINKFRENFPDSPISEAKQIGDRLLSEDFEETADEEIKRLYRLKKELSDYEDRVDRAITAIYNVLDYRWL